MILRAAVLCLVLPIATSAAADDAYYGASGAPAGLAQSNQIEMRSETVHMWIGSKRTHVRATFHFVNHGGAITVRMGFPDDTYNSGGKLEIKRIDSWVDGRHVAMHRSSIKQQTEDFNILPKVSWQEVFWVKTVSFRDHGIRSVVVDYLASNVNDEHYNGIHYILTTGSTWKGPIRECRIIVDWRKLNSYLQTSFGKQYGYDQDRVIYRSRATAARIHTFVFRDFKPTFDFDVDW